MDNELKEFLGNIQASISDLQTSMTGMSGRMDHLESGLNSRMDHLESGLKQDVTELKQDVSGLKQDVTVLKQDVSGLKQDVTVLKQDVSDIKITIENDTNKKISALYDGYVNYLNYQEELIQVHDKVNNHEMRIDNLEKAYSFGR